MRIARESELRKLLEFGRDASKLVHFPGGSVVVVDQPKERLLLAAEMAVKGPCENSLRA